MDRHGMTWKYTSSTSCRACGTITPKVLGLDRIWFLLLSRSVTVTMV